jgi:hypothetical protein
MSILKDIIDALEDRQVLLIAAVLYTVDEKQANKIFDFVKTVTGIDISKVGNIYRLTDAEVDKLKNFEIDSHDKLRQIIAQMDTPSATEKKDMVEFVKFKYYLASALILVSMIYLFFISFYPIPNENRHFVDTSVGMVVSMVLSVVIGYFFRRPDRLDDHNTEEIKDKNDK